ncbi:MAG: Stp1/IreP family PP2C-type Ser/Thr phosphatase [Anaerolineaceae bacterium]|nr:MAG: Stp1/IreP family PP2C-type Ser/Thr phosphatase [Anaerolineaceae bacterium]
MSNAEREIRLRSSGHTDTGQVRDNNEDNIHLWHQDDQRVLAVVADGMGGAVAGEEASRIAVETVKSDLIAPYIANSRAEWGDDGLSAYLQDTIRHANNNIIEQARKRPELRGMGTTVTLAYVQGRKVIVGHVGDSRAYLVKHTGGGIQQITSDHSFVQALVDGGHLTSEEALGHPMGNVLYRALGQTQDLEIDVYHTQLDAQDRLLLCSDGLTLHLLPEEIAAIALKHDDPAAIIQELVALTNERGGRDNVSVIVVVADGIAGADSAGESTVHASPLSSHENSPPVAIPRENSNMGASEPQAKRSTTTSTQEIVRVSTPDTAGESTPTGESTSAGDEPSSDAPDEPGEGRDHLLPDQ